MYNLFKSAAAATIKQGLPSHPSSLARDAKLHTLVDGYFTKDFVEDCSSAPTTNISAPRRVLTSSSSSLSSSLSFSARVSDSPTNSDEDSDNDSDVSDSIRCVFFFPVFSFCFYPFPFPLSFTLSFFFLLSFSFCFSPSLQAFVLTFI